VTPAELIPWLRRRLDEDEATARAAIHATDAEWEYARTPWGQWQVQTVATHGTPGYEQHLAVTWDREGLSDSVGTEAGVHMARHDPARVVRDVEAKRSLLGLLETDLADPRNALRRQWAAEVLVLLAATYQEPGRDSG
jgi:hypothetical protein